MKRFDMFAVLVLILTGCASGPHREVVLQYWPGDAAIVKGDAGLRFTPRELEQIARGYTERERLDFDYSSPDPRIFVFTDRRPTLVKVVWGGGIGHRAMVVEIDGRGEVVRHWIGATGG